MNWRVLNRAECPHPSTPAQNLKFHTKAIIKNDMVWQRELYHNPDPLYHLIGSTNESMLLVEGESPLALIDSGATISTVKEDLGEHVLLPIKL